MNWFIRRSPFGQHEDPVQHLVAILSREAETAGTPLTDTEKEILAREHSPNIPIPEELRQSAKQLIARIFDAEPRDEFERDPKSFSNSLEWTERGNPNIAVLAEEISRENPHLSPPWYGWKRVKDRLQLVGCALIVILLMFAVVIALGFLFHWK